MSDTYTQIHIHLIFAVQNRMSLIKDKWRDDLYKYINSIIKGEGHKPLSIGGMPDHIHILFGLRPNQALSSLMQKIKKNSSDWINENKFVMGKFSWQAGYGAFSYSKSQIKRVIIYIENQEQHHKNINFVDEFKIFLEKFQVEYNEKYIFHNIED